MFRSLFFHFITLGNKIILNFRCGVFFQDTIFYGTRRNVSSLKKKMLRKPANKSWRCQNTDHRTCSDCFCNGRQIVGKMQFREPNSPTPFEWMHPRIIRNTISVIESVWINNQFDGKLKHRNCRQPGAVIWRIWIWNSAYIHLRHRKCPQIELFARMYPMQATHHFRQREDEILNSFCSWADCHYAMSAASD